MWMKPKKKQSKNLKNVWIKIKLFTGKICFMNLLSLKVLYIIYKQLLDDEMENPLREQSDINYNIGDQSLSIDTKINPPKYEQDNLEIYHEKIDKNYFYNSNIDTINNQANNLHQNLIPYQTNNLSASNNSSHPVLNGHNNYPQNSSINFTQYVNQLNLVNNNNNYSTPGTSKKYIIKQYNKLDFPDEE